MFFVNFLTKLDYTMKKTTTKKSITRRVAEYGAAASILGIGADASGQIVYTDINPDEGGAGVMYVLDMDNDTSPEMIFVQYNYLGLLDLLYAQQNTNVSVIGNGDSSSGYPNVLDLGDVISSANSNWNSGMYQLFNANNCAGFYGYFTGGQWCSATDKYIGLKFMIGSDTHYGWARLDVTSSSSWLIKDYAYNSTPDAPIEAGQTVLGLGDNFVKTVKVVGLKNTIALYNLPDSADYKVISMTGKTLLSGETNGEYYVIENETISTGVYIVELTNKTTGEQLRKKVIL